MNIGTATHATRFEFSPLARDLPHIVAHYIGRVQRDPGHKDSYGGLTLNNDMNNNQDLLPEDQPRGQHGGARPGAGRPVGSRNKISGQAILQALEGELGHDYAKRLALNYVDTMMAGDTDRLFKYDQLILSKVVADKVDIALSDSEDALAAKQRAFGEVLDEWVRNRKDN